MTNPADNPTGMACPRCAVGLLMSDRQGIEIDFCPKCRGVWLDRGELDKIIERSAQYGGRNPEQASSISPAQPQSPWTAPTPLPSGYPAPGWDQSYEPGGYGGHGDRGQRRKSWLADLFD